MSHSNKDSWQRQLQRRVERENADLRSAVTQVVVDVGNDLIERSRLTREAKQIKQHLDAAVQPFEQKRNPVVARIDAAIASGHLPALRAITGR